MSKVVCVLYDDPVKGYPKKYARDDLPKLTHYPGGQSLPTPPRIDVRPGALLGSGSGERALERAPPKAAPIKSMIIPLCPASGWRAICPDGLPPREFSFYLCLAASKRSASLRYQSWQSRFTSS